MLKPEQLINHNKPSPKGGSNCCAFRCDCVISCVIVFYFFPTSLVTEWVCVYAYTEPLGQHAGISELFLIIYLILCRYIRTLQLALKQSGTKDEITDGISLLRTNIMCSLSFEILEIFRLTVSFLCPPPTHLGLHIPYQSALTSGRLFESLEHD